MRTYCNPLNLDYAYCPIPDCVQQGKHRATADPVVLTFQGDYYLFSTNQWGYWWSPDMVSWTFVPRKFLKDMPECYDELCAPAVWGMGDAMYVIGSTYTDQFIVWKTTDPKAGLWEEAAVSQYGGWDPAYFLDDDGRLYLYHGSGNTNPIYGVEIDPVTLQAIGERQGLCFVDPDKHGWERFGEHLDNTWLLPFIEGAWMTKHDGRYYLQYGAPATEFSGYGDGVYVGDAPLGPFTYQAHNPFSYKPGGYARGAGHGATYQDLFGNWWHVSTITIAVKNNFERRNGIWPAGFDADGVMFCNTAYGDYPWLLPHRSAVDHRVEGFAGWMLLNYAKPVQASSTLGGFSPNFAVDESMRTYWSAATGDPGEWFQTDLGAVSTVYAVQVNYADQDSDGFGKLEGYFHQYVLRASLDGVDWWTVVDKSRNQTDVPHDYVELESPTDCRYLRLENIHMPTGKFALSGLRVFGLGHGLEPKPVQRFTVLRGDQGDRRNAWLKWQATDLATGYVVYFGVAPDMLYNSVMLYGTTDYFIKALDRDLPYYFQIEAFNEAGISGRSEVVRAD